MCNTCVRFFVFINHFSSSVCVSSCNQRGDYLIGLGYSDLKMRVWWSQDSNDDYAGIIPMVYNCTYHPRKDYLHYGVILHITRKALCIIRFPSHYPLKISNEERSLELEFFFSRGFFKWCQHYRTGEGLGQRKGLAFNVILFSRQ